jgi:HAD superfamily hydrolase (TIGR01549 family)
VLIRAILIDVGGPLLDEDQEYAAWNDFLKAELSVLHQGAWGRFLGALQEAIARCDPSPWLSALWEVSRPDVASFRKLVAKLRSFQASYLERKYVPRLRPGASEVLAHLAGHYQLALAGNQPRTVKRFLEEAGMISFFSWKLVSEEMGVAKPDPLFFRMILSGLAVQPAEAIMVGDRLDKDVLPAKLLGMRTVRVLAGPYRDQRPISPLHRPDVEVGSLTELPAAIEALEDHFSP